MCVRMSSFRRVLKMEMKKRKNETNFLVKMFHIKTCNSIDNGYLLFTLQCRLFVCIHGYSTTSVWEIDFLSLKFHFVEILFLFFENEMLFHWFHRVSASLLSLIVGKIWNVPVTKIGKLYHSSIFLSRFLCICLVSFRFSFSSPVAWSHFECWDGKF